MYFYCRSVNVCLQDMAVVDSGSDSDFDSDESLDLPEDYGDRVDFNSFLGQSIALWTYTNPDSLVVFNPRRGDTLWHTTQFMASKFGYDRDSEKIMIMEPGDRTPKSKDDVYHLTQGSVVMVMPKKNINITVEVNQLKVTIPMSADPMCTVHEVKGYIRRVKGISVEQQDLLYRDRVLENSRRLYEYKVRMGSNMHLLIQVHFDLLVNVETFWGKTYRLYIDRCNTGSDVLYRVFGRTFSRHGTKHVTVHELYVPIHVLVFQHNKRSLHWDYCLGFYGLRSGDTLKLNTVGMHSDMNMQTFLVRTDMGDNFEVTVSQFDRWAVVAFMVHGITDVPVDLIRLSIKDKQMEFTKVIGNQPRSTVIMVTVTMTDIDKDVLFGIPLKVSVGHSIIENVKMLPTKTVKDLKTRLEEIGVPNAATYEICAGIFKLPDSGQLSRVIMDLDKVLQLKVERYPIFLHGQQGVIYKTMVDVNQTMYQLGEKIQMKTGHAISSCRLIMAGTQLRLPDKANLYDNAISTRNSIFITVDPVFETFYITAGSFMTKLRVPVIPTADMIKRSVWTTKDIPEGSITCLQTFFFWFFSPRVNKKYASPRRRKNRIRLPAAYNPLQTMSDRGDKDDFRIPTGVLAQRSQRKPKLHLPPLGPASHEAESETQQTWPLTLARPVRHRRNVEEWMEDALSAPRLDTRHLRTPTRKKLTTHHSTQHGKKLEARLLDKVRRDRLQQHLVPRWVNELQKTDRHGLLVSDVDGLVYRGDPLGELELNLRPKPRSKHKTHASAEGINMTARYLRAKRYFDTQELIRQDKGSDSDSEDDIYQRPQIALR